MKQIPKQLALNQASVGPVAPVSRLPEIDMLRGFALFGVLLVNMYGFGADSVAWNSPVDQLTFALMQVFFESTSLTLFSILFGFSFETQLQRADAQGFRILPAYLRRLAVLFAFGAAHALLYDGDILMLYAELGLVLLLVRRLPTRGLLLVAVGLMLAFPLARLASIGDEPAGMQEAESVAESRDRLERSQDTHVYAIGSLVKVAADNASAIPADPLEDLQSLESGLAVFAMFLLGLCIGRAGVMRDVSGQMAVMMRMRVWGLTFGLAAMAAERVLVVTTGYAVYRPQQAGLGIQFIGDLLLAFGSTALTFGYAAVLILVAQTPRGRTALAPLAKVGRLALTVYLSQTLIFTTLFYGYGFGQVFRLGPVGVTVWAVMIFSVQVVACQWWSRRFLFGPMEWLWRSLIYLEWQPLRLPSESAPQA